jgi:iron complex transport system permease protein
MGLRHLVNSFIQKLLQNKSVWMYIFCVGLLLCAALLSLMISSVTIPVPVILNIVVKHITGFGWIEDAPKNIDMIIWEIRFPRVLLGLCVGAALSIAGAAFQGLLRNPLADPFTIGVSSGAALGAVSVLFFKFTIIGLGDYTLPVISILCGLATLLLVFGVTRLSSRHLSIETIILAGIIVSSFISAVISLIISLSGREGAGQILYWLMGSLGMRGWSHVTLFFPFLVIGALILLFFHRELNALALGESSAQYIGVNVNKSKIWILIGASLLTGAAVAVSGSVGFVGLVIPHLVRLVVGPNHRHVLPLSILAGGGYLVIADLLARTLIAPSELPIGVITALIGTPIFAVLLVRKKAGKG